LDLGGGTGFFLLAMLRQHSTLEAVLYDAPAVAALARLRIVEGDFFTDPLPVPWTP
jgi:hypothetical protein